MKISTKDWTNYIHKLSALSQTAGEQMTKWVQLNGFSDTNALIDYAYGLVTKYGEGSAELSALMYDAVAEMEGVAVPAAIPAETASIGDTAKAINGSLKRSPSGQMLESVVQRLVKQAGADTTLQNAQRDGAQFAWIPSGDTCAFCITLASRGWQYASRKTIQNGHAEHIHANCDCQYAIRFSNKTQVSGYDPQEYRDMYYSEDGKPQDKINAMRRKSYAENKDAINAQKREAYARRTAKTATTDTIDFSQSVVKDTVYHGTDVDNIKEFITSGRESNGAIFFANDPDYAEEEAYIKSEKSGNDAVIYDVKLAINNPYYATIKGSKFGDPTVEKKFIEEAKKNGYDSVIFDNGEEDEWMKQTFYAVFNPKQVKIIGNNKV